MRRKRYVIVPLAVAFLFLAWAWGPPASHLAMYYSTFGPEQADDRHACDDCVLAIIEAGMSE